MLDEEPVEPDVLADDEAWVDGEAFEDDPDDEVRADVDELAFAPLEVVDLRAAAAAASAAAFCAAACCCALVHAAWAAVTASFAEARDETWSCAAWAAAVRESRDVPAAAWRTAVADEIAAASA